MAINVKGLSGELQEVNADNEALVALTQDPTKAGTVRIVNSDGGDIDTTENNYLRVSTSALVLYEQVDGSNINTNVWNPSSGNSATIGQSGGFITLSGGTAINGYSILQSIKSIPLYGTLPLLVEINAKVLNVPEANAAIEIGLGAAATTSAPTDGIFFRWTPTGGFIAVINNGGSETASANLAAQTFTDNSGDSITLPPSTISIHLYSFEVVEDQVLFYVDDILVATINTPSGNAFPTNAGRQTVFCRVYNGGSAPSLAPSLGIGQVLVKQEDLYQNKSWGETLAVLGRGAYQNPVSAFGQNANHANSTSPSSATLSNTAAGYTTLGGRFQFAAVAGAVTDFALFGFQVPAGYQLFITGISISLTNTGAVNSITVPTVLDWGIGVNASAVSLATADGSGTWAPRRIPLGIQSLATSSLLGAMPPDLVRAFPVPLVVDSGRFFHVILQVPVGAATASQIIRGNAMVNGYFE